jgi:GNAT superfamily N-acetyltransferase
VQGNATTDAGIEIARLLLKNGATLGCKGRSVLRVTTRQAHSSRRDQVKARFETRRATEADGPAIAAGHIDSIQSLGPAYYPPDVVAAWSAGLTADVYVNAMRAGEVFFIAEGVLAGAPVVLGFASHRVDDDQDGASVYVRGGAARQGIGRALLQLAINHARAHGATSIQIQASLAGIDFYRAHGFEALGRGEALLMSGKAMECEFMRKIL